MKRRVLVLGANGMLGHKVCQGLRDTERIAAVRRRPDPYWPDHPIFPPLRLVEGVDAASRASLQGLLERERPDAVVNCVGIVKQLREAEDAELSVELNALLPHRLARICAEIGARLVHISTDCVFDGQRGAYREDETPNARDLYGRSKALGETLASEPAAVTLRTSFIGRELKAPGHGLVEWFLRQSPGDQVPGFSHAVYSGLTSLELVRVIERVIEDPTLSGLYQVAAEPIRKLDLLRLLAREMRPDLEVEPRAEPRYDRSLVMDRFQRETGYEAPGWEAMIAEMARDPTPYDALRASDGREEER